MNTRRQLGPGPAPVNLPPRDPRARTAAERIADADWVVPTDRVVTGRPLMALAQAAKYATSNGDSRTAQHAIDLICEIGAAIAELDRDFAPVPAAVLDETVQILERVANKIEKDGWSVCPCDEDHGQARADAAVPKVMRDDADFVRTVRASIDR